tara:strand:- start:55191 stop:56456 length:1266 start_codon:yes stop_codon:yes gene_type:complete
MINFASRISFDPHKNKDMPHIYTMIRIAFFTIMLTACGSDAAKQEDKKAVVEEVADSQIKVGAAQMEEYLPLLQNKNVGMVVNHTTMLGETHLVDSLLSRGIAIKKIFAPEHGFRGDTPAGDKVGNEVDSKTGIPILSLYGSHNKPTKEDLSGLDVVIFDIQDVGARFYTYTSTMSYAMEACAENGLPFIVLDRPNPLGNVIDGPVLEEAQKSFVGLHPIPIAYGLTMGELATMINNEGWLENSVKADLQVIKLANWTHSSSYNLPVSPSPNLPTDHSIAWYPSICLFEGTMMSLGRGTHFPFEVLGYPSPEFGDFQFTPVPIPGMSMDPKHQDKLCYGTDLRQAPVPNAVDLSYLISFYKKTPADSSFFNNYFALLAGTPDLRKQIEKGMSEAEIKATWQKKLDAYKQIRKKHLLYDDFE